MGMCGIVAVNRTGWWWRSASCYTPSKAHGIPTTWSVAIVLVLNGASAGVSPVTRQDEHDALVVDCCRHPLLADPTTSGHVPTSRGASAKFGSCSSISLRPTPIVLLPLHLPAGVRHDAEQLASNAPSGDAFQDLTLHRVALRSFRLQPRCTPPLLHILTFSSLSGARLCPIHPLVIQGLELTVPLPPPGGGWCNPLQEEELGIFAASPVVVALWVPLLVIPHSRKGRGETTPSPS